MGAFRHPTFIIDGIFYDEYPDDRERIANLIADRDAWRATAIEATRRAMRPTH